MRKKKLKQFAWMIQIFSGVLRWFLFSGSILRSNFSFSSRFALCNIKTSAYSPFSCLLSLLHWLLLLLLLVVDNPLLVVVVLPLLLVLLVVVLSHLLLMVVVLVVVMQGYIVKVVLLLIQFSSSSLLTCLHEVKHFFHFPLLLEHTQGWC